MLILFSLPSLQANVFDTAGGERFRTLTSNYFQHTDAAILMYSVDDQRSLDRLYDEAENAYKFIEPDTFVWAVVGNKADLPSEVDEATGKALANQIGAKVVVRTSAKTGLNVTSSMDMLVKTLHRKVTRSGHVQSESLSKDDGTIHRLTDADNATASPNVTSASSKTSTPCCN